VVRALLRRVPLSVADHGAGSPTDAAAKRDRRRRVELEPFAPSECCVMLDGLPLPEVGVPHAALVDGDAHCMSIAAAGVVAKTVRDELMARLARRYPRYGWETNMGYGTAGHHAGLRAHGPCVHHRQTFAPIAQLELL
jgi:ribonuclease HII